LVLHLFVDVRGDLLDALLEDEFAANQLVQHALLQRCHLSRGNTTTLPRHLVAECLHGGVEILAANLRPVYPGHDLVARSGRGRDRCGFVGGSCSGCRRVGRKCLTDKCPGNGEHGENDTNLHEYLLSDVVYLSS